MDVFYNPAANPEIKLPVMQHEDSPLLGLRGMCRHNESNSAGKNMNATRNKDSLSSNASISPYYSKILIFYSNRVLNFSQKDKIK